MRSMPASLAAVAVFVLALACGTGSTLSAKLMYQLEVTNSVGEMAHYSKPVFISLLAFVSLVPFWPLRPFWPFWFLAAPLAFGGGCWAFGLAPCPPPSAFRVR